MKTYTDLIATIQVGTNRTGLPASDLIPESVAASLEHRALLLAGAIDLMSRAGASPSRTIPATAEAPPERRPIAEKAAEPLSEAFAANLTDLIGLWALQAEKRGKVAPHSSLISLLSLLKRHEKIPQSVLGERGRWLAALQGMTLEPTVQKSPEELRAWLAAEFDTLDWKERATAIEALRAGLKLTDEPLLERALVDRRREVREPACDLLAELDNSRLQRELNGLARNVFTVERSLLRKSMTVNPPEPDKLPKGVPSTKARKDFGPKAVALFDLVRFTKPRFWSAATNLAETQILEFIAKSDYAIAALDGLQEAAIRFKDQGWIDALFKFLWDHDPLRQEWWPLLAHFSSEDLFQRQMLEKARNLSNDNDHVLWTLGLSNRPLSPALSQTVVNKIMEGKGYFVKLGSLAPYLDTSCLPLLETPFSNEPSVEQMRQQIYKTINLRKRLLDSLD